MRQRAFDKKSITKLSVRTAVFSLVLTLLFSLLSPSMFAMSDFSQHKTNTFMYGTTDIDTCLAVSKTVRNADGSPLTDGQKTQLFAFTVTFSDGGTYHYVVRSAPQTLSGAGHAGGENAPLPAAQEEIQTPPPTEETPAPSPTEESPKPSPTEPEPSKQPSGDHLFTPLSRRGPLKIVNLSMRPSTGRDVTELPGIDSQETPEPILPGVPDDNDEILPGDVSEPVIDSGDEEASPPAQAETPPPADDEPEAPVSTPPEPSGAVEDVPSPSAPPAAVSESPSPTDSATETPANSPDLEDDPDDAFSVMDVILSEGDLASGGTLYLTDGLVALFPYLPSGITYTVTETAVTGYVATSVNHSGVLTEYGAMAAFTNTFGAETVTIAGEKTWDLALAPAGYVLPTEITVYLMDGNTQVSSAVVRPDIHGKWTYSFTAPKYRQDGSEILYTIVEASVTNFTPTVRGHNILNRYVPPQEPDDTVVVSGVKTWRHGSNNPANYPQSITIQIKANGAVVETIPVSAANGWQWSRVLPKYDGLGAVITYTVDEVDVPGYTKTINGYNITNTYIDEEEVTPTPPPEVDPPTSSPSPSPSGGADPGTESSPPPSVTGETDISPTPPPLGPPKTDDAGSSPLWILLMCISAFGLLYVWCYPRTKKPKNN